MYGIFTYIWLIFMVNVGKYTSPMDPMGKILGESLGHLFFFRSRDMKPIDPHRRDQNSLETNSLPLKYRPSQNGIPFRELTYPTWGKGKSSSKCHFWGDMLIPWRVFQPSIFSGGYDSLLVCFREART